MVNSITIESEIIWTYGLEDEFFHNTTKPLTTVCITFPSIDIATSAVPAHVNHMSN